MAARLVRALVLTAVALTLVVGGLLGTASATPCPNGRNFCGWQNADFLGNRLFNFNADGIPLHQKVNFEDDILSSAKNHSSGGILCFSETVTLGPDFSWGWMSSSTSGGEISNLNEIDANNKTDYVTWEVGPGGCA